MFFAFSRGRRAFSLAALLMLLTALAHTLGNVRPVTDPERRLLITQMAAYRMGLGLNMMPSIWDIYQNLAFTMSITFLGLGMVNLMLGASPDASAGLLRRVSWMNLVWVGAFIALAAAFQVGPSLISGVLVLAAVLAALR
jgi:hypothetical protein